MIIEYNKEKNLNINKTIIEEKTIKKELKSNPFGKYLLVIENQNIIGYLYYSEIYDRVEINQIEIEISHRNCGLGTKLLKKLILTVEKNITLEVKNTNYCAIHLYEKFNFKKIAIRKGYYHGIDGILMERNIK